LDLLPGENWEVEIPNAIFSSDVILVCLSKNSVDKEGYVQKEISFALDKALEKPEGTIFIVPVKLEDCDVPKRLNRFQWVDVFRQDGYKRLMLGLQKRASGLGADVSPVILDDARRTTAPRTPKPEIKKPEEQIVSVPVKEEVKEEPKKEIQAKPFTKLLDPSSLSPNEKSTLGPPVGRVSNPTESLAPKKRQAKSLTYGFWGIALLVLLLGGFGLNSLFKNPPVVNVTVSPTKTATSTATPELPTSTSVPFTPTPQPIKTPIPTPTLGIGSTWTRPADGMEMVYVPEGEFTMGSNDGSDDEKPAHQVYLDAYWIDRTEVTNAMYAKCVLAGPCKSNPGTSVRSSEYDEYPVASVQWDDARSYCSWAEVRLPTEAEWEKAARGTDARIYPWGNDKDPAKYYVATGNSQGVKPAGSYLSGASPYSALGMAGGVLEWVNDWYSLTYYQDSPSSNPQGPANGDWHVLRGGSQFDVVSFARSTYRGPWNPWSANGYFGFRCARSP
jgi:formylglycine-generating enzyme required for sulfatase activity